MGWNGTLRLDGGLGGMSGTGQIVAGDGEEGYGS
jgi:hypothetical protein